MNNYSVIEEEWLMENGPLYSREELTKEFNETFEKQRTVSGINTFCKRHNIPSPKTYQLFTDSEKEWLKKHSIFYSRKELTELFNRIFGKDKTESSVATFCKAHGFKACKDGRYKKGNKTWDTGMSKEEHRSHFSEESYSNVMKALEARTFHNVGDRYMMKIGGVAIPYIVISMDTTLPFRKRLMPETRYVWEQHYGEIPEGYLVVHLDGNILNNDIENLALVNNYERLVLNGNHWWGDPEITKTGIAYAQLLEAIKEAK